MFALEAPTLLPEMALPIDVTYCIAARKHCTIAEAVYWKDDIDSATASANKLYSYEVRLFGIAHVLHSETDAIDSPYNVGDAVWVKPSDNRCHTKYKLGTVTGVVSEPTWRWMVCHDMYATCDQLYRHCVLHGIV